MTGIGRRSTLGICSICITSIRPPDYHFRTWIHYFHFQYLVFPVATYSIHMLHINVHRIEHLAKSIDNDNYLYAQIWWKYLPTTQFQCKFFQTINWNTWYISFNLLGITSPPFSLSHSVSINNSVIFTHTHTHSQLLKTMNYYSRIMKTNKQKKGEWEWKRGRPRQAFVQNQHSWNRA